jgi:hypothetical protein
MSYKRTVRAKDWYDEIGQFEMKRAYLSLCEEMRDRGWLVIRDLPQTGDYRIRVVEIRQVDHG